jgi:hypothetical protein
MVDVTYIDKKLLSVEHLDVSEEMITKWEV